MKLSSLWRVLIFIIIIMMIIGQTIFLVITNPHPDPAVCLDCELKGLKYLGIAAIILGLVSLGLITRIRNSHKY